MNDLHLANNRIALRPIGYPIEDGAVLFLLCDRSALVLIPRYFVYLSHQEISGHPINTKEDRYPQLTWKLYGLQPRR